MKFFIMVLMFSFAVFAQDAQPVATAAAPAVAATAQPVLDGAQKAVDTLKAVDAKVPVSLPATALAVIAFISEVGLRIYPTAKPKSLFLLVAAALGLVGSIFTKLSQFLDGIVQNLKDGQ